MLKGYSLSSIKGKFFSNKIYLFCDDDLLLSRERFVTWWPTYTWLRELDFQTVSAMTSSQLGKLPSLCPPTSTLLPQPQLLKLLSPWDCGLLFRWVSQASVSSSLGEGVADCLPYCRSKYMLALSIFLDRKCKYMA